MDRRQFLRATKIKGTQQKANPLQVRGLESGLNAYSGPWSANEVAHLLKRTMFGATKTDIDYFLGMSTAEAVDELLNNIPSVTPPLRDYGLIETETGAYDDLGVAIGQTWINDLNKVSNEEAKGRINRLRIESIRKWWAGLIIHQNRSINEKMVLFWHHHFSVQREEVDNATTLYRHHALLRTNAMGNVRELTKAVTIDPAMLAHLNGFLNSKLAPDENYARELQELFTVGRGNDSLYNEEDVRAAAKVLTGWRINADTLTSSLEENMHDTSNKTFSSFYNNTTIAGSSNGTQEVDQLINMIFSTEECARFICRKIYKWFVYYDIDTDTENNVIIPLAQIFRNNNFSITPVLEALLKSDHFFDPSNQACFIKAPYDFIAGTLREFSVSFPAMTDYVNAYPLFYSLYGKASDMQQNLLQPPDVAGWPAYFQDPMNYELWINSNSLPKRAEFTDTLIEQNMLNVRAFANYSSNAADPDQLLNDITLLLLRYPLSAASKTYLKNRFLINNSGDDSIWTNAWNSNNNAVITPALKELFKFIMNLPEFHLC
ncbi:MAG: DUF1800 domain-containing protein [Flavitalea sp.]